MVAIRLDTGEIIARLNRVSSVLDDMTPVYQDIGEYLVEATKKRFITSTAPDGTKWQAKSPATIARYLAKKDGNRPKPLIGPSGRLGKEISQLATRDQVEIGSALIYSGVMQDGAAKGAFGTAANGSPIPWGRIPARVWLGLSDVDNRNILDIANEHLAEAIGE